MTPAVKSALMAFGVVSVTLMTGALLAILLNSVGAFSGAMGATAFWGWYLFFLKSES